MQGKTSSNLPHTPILTKTRPIIDDGYLHALRIYRDRDSKAVRLQASVLRGEMKRLVITTKLSCGSTYTNISNRAPVWTAFITNYLRSPQWLTRAGPDVVCLGELRRHVFSAEYVPEQTNQGEHMLKFTSDHGKVNRPDMGPSSDATY